MKRLFLISVASLFGALCQAEVSPDRSRELQSFIAAVQASADAGAKGGDKAARGDSMQMALIQLNAGRRDAEGIQATLASVRPYLATEDLRRQCDQLVSELRSDEAEQEKSTREHLNDVLRRAAVAVREAKQPADLDKTLEELRVAGQHRSNGRLQSPEDISLIEKVGLASRFANGWQSYLAASRSGKHAQVVEILRQLSNENWIEAIPRSQILSLQWEGAPQDAAAKAPSNGPSPKAILQSIKSLDDLSAAAQALSALDPARIESYREEGFKDLTATQRSLNELDVAYRSFKAGLPTQVAVFPPISAAADPGLAFLTPVRAQLVALLLPRYLGLPEREKVPPGQKPDEFLAQVASKARRDRDFLLLARAQSVLELFQQGSSGTGVGNSQAALYATGVAQQEGSEWALAVISFEKALATGSNLVPAQAIGERLHYLKAMHPQEYQQGMDSYLASTSTPNKLQPDAGPRPAKDQPEAKSPVLSVPAVSTPVPTAPPMRR